MSDRPFIERLRRALTALLLVSALLPTAEAAAAYRASLAGCIHGAMSACCCTKGCARNAKPAEGMQCHRTQPKKSDSDDGACFRRCSRGSDEATFAPHVLRFSPSPAVTASAAVGLRGRAFARIVVQPGSLAASPPSPPPRSL